MIRAHFLQGLIMKHLPKNLLLSSLFALSSAFSWSAFSQPAQAESFTLVWSANLNTSLSSNDWNVYNNAPFSSSANACFMAPNASVKNKLLGLSINRNTNGCSRPYSSGGLDTYIHHAQNYGKWSVRAKFPKGQGVVGYIGLFVADGSSWPPEIDFAEVIGRDPQTVYLTQHYTLNGSTLQDGLNVQSGVDWTADYHTYTLEWVPGQLRYYIDNVLWLTQNQNFDAPAAKMKLAIGTGTGDCGSWVDCPASSFKSAALSVSSIMIYQYNP